MAPTEHFDDNQEHTAQAAEHTKTSPESKRARTPRKPKTPAAEEQAASQTDSSGETSVTPPKRTRSRKKNLAAEQTAPNASAQPQSDSSEVLTDPPAKPARKRRTSSSKTAESRAETPDESTLAPETLPEEKDNASSGNRKGSQERTRTQRKPRAGTRKKLVAEQGSLVEQTEQGVATRAFSTPVEESPENALQQEPLSYSPEKTTPQDLLHETQAETHSTTTIASAPEAAIEQATPQAALPCELQEALTERPVAPEELPAEKKPAPLVMREEQPAPDPDPFFAKPPVVDDFSSSLNRQGVSAQGTGTSAGTEEASRRKRPQPGGQEKPVPESVETPPAQADLPPVSSEERQEADETPASPASGEDESAPHENAAGRPRSRSARRRAAAARRKAEARAAEAARNAAQQTQKNVSDATRDEDVPEAPEQAESLKAAAGPDRKMLVSVLPDELVEVVLIENGTVAEYYVEMVHQAKIRGNIYKGVISNIDPNLQAAFVNFGNTKNGFLQIDEIHPEYWLTHYESEKGGKYPPIQKVMKPGQEVLVQIVKEPNGSKGAFLTTWVSLAGRFLVLTPGQEQIGISRKVEDGEERNRLRELIKGLNPGEGLGAIVRTVSEGTSKTTLQKDLGYLKRVWKDIHKRAGTEKAPSLIYAEPGLASRSIRDYLSEDVSEIWVDDAKTAESMRAMTSLLFPRRTEFVHLYENQGKSLWEHFNIRKQLEQVHSREVTLPSGGRLVFDQTEALMAVDINSGKSGGKSNFEATALRTNLEAAESIARQLRLRDVGGQIVIDFIEMRDQNRCREVEKTLHAAMKNDRARHDIGRMSSFGLLQIVRQRIGSSAISISQEPCPHCKGTGTRRNLEWQALQFLREMRIQIRLAAKNGQTEYACSLGTELAIYVLNNKRERLAALEKEFNLRIEIRIAPGEAH